MMHVKLVTVGKLKERFFKEAAEEYKKRLSRYCKIEIVEVPDEPIRDGASLKEEQKILEKEGNAILKELMGADAVITLCVEGKMMDSVALSGELSKLAISGKQTVAFVIGGSLGLDERVKQASALRLSFSPMTFPHQLMRVMLLEQIYRGFKILNHETYHK